MVNLTHVFIFEVIRLEKLRFYCLFISIHLIIYYFCALMLILIAMTHTNLFEARGTFEVVNRVELSIAFISPAFLIHGISSLIFIRIAFSSLRMSSPGLVRIIRTLYFYLSFAYWADNHKETVIVEGYFAVVVFLSSVRTTVYLFAGITFKRQEVLLMTHLHCAVLTNF